MNIIFYELNLIKLVKCKWTPAAHESFVFYFTYFAALSSSFSPEEDSMCYTWLSWMKRIRRKGIGVHGCLSKRNESNITQGYKIKSENTKRLGRRDRHGLVSETTVYKLLEQHAMPLVVLFVYVLLTYPVCTYLNTYIYV